MWKKVGVASMEMNVGTCGCREGEARQKLHNSNALVAQNTLMIKKKTL